MSLRLNRNGFAGVGDEGNGTGVDKPYSQQPSQLIINQHPEFTNCGEFAGEEEEERNGVDNPQSQPGDELSHRFNPLSFNKYNLFKWVENNSALLEKEFRKPVQQGVEHAIQRFFFSNSRSSLTHPGEPSETRKYKLEFEGTFPRKVFTENKLVANKGIVPLRVRLLDVVNEQVIIDGPLSSKRVEIVALHDHFKAEQLDNWTEGDFNKNIVTKRPNKRPLLVGQRVISLRNGTGLVDDVRFTDNSCWVRSKKFRFGAKLVGEQDQVMEAVSNPFQVKDRRGEAYKKHDIPSPEDEVWRLRGIAPNGKIRKRLEGLQIHKVKDLVTKYQTDQSLLHDTLNLRRKKWDEIIKHATSSCFPSNDDNDSVNLREDLAQLHIPIEQQNVGGSQSNNVDAGEHINQLDQPMAVDNSLLDEWTYNNVHQTSVVYSMPPSFATVFDVQPSSYLPGQSMTAEGIGMPSSVPSVDFNTYNITNLADP